MGYFKGLFYIQNDIIYSIKAAENINNLRYSFTKENVDYFYTIDLSKSYSFDGKEFKEVYLKTKSQSIIDFIKDENKFIGFDSNVDLFFYQKNDSIIYSKRGYTYFRKSFFNKSSFIRIINKSNPRIHDRKINGFLYNDNLKDYNYPYKIESIFNTDFDNNYNIYFNKEYKVFFKGKHDVELSKKLNLLQKDLINIHSILIDKNKNFWVLSKDNKLKFIENNFEYFKKYEFKNNLKIKSSVLLDSSVYILDYDNTVFFYNPKTNLLKPIYKIENKRTRRIELDKKNSILIYSGEGIEFLKINKAKILEHKKIKEFNQSLFKKNEDFYTVSNSAIKKNFNTIDSLHTNVNFKNIYEKNNIIYAANQDFLYKIDLSTNKKNKYNLYNEVSCITSYDEYLILGTISEGVKILNSEMKIINQLEKNKNIYSIIVRNKQLFVSTSTYFSIYNYISNKFILQKKIDIKDFSDGIINSIQITNDIIYLSTSEDIIFIENKFNDKINKKTEIEINQIKGNDKTIKNLNFNTKLTFERDDNSLEFLVSTFGFNLNNNLKKTYRLTKNKETGNWYEFNQNKVILSNLNPGTYKLEFRLSNSKNQTIDSKTIMFDIKYYFWETWSFLFFIISFLILLIIFTLYYYYNRLLRKSKLKLRIYNLELKALKMQMSPHFIFNSINNFQSIFVLEGESKANQFLNKFTGLIRQTLEISNSDIIDLNNEIDYLKNYVFIETTKTGLEVDFEVNFDSNLELSKYKIPVLLLQPIIENSLKHAFIKGLTKENKIVLTIENISNKNLKITIEDNGIGRKKSHEMSKNLKFKHQSIANQIIKERILLLNKTNRNTNKIKYIVEDILINEELKGTRVIFTIPIS